MTVPLIQATLAFAYSKDINNNALKTSGIDNTREDMEGAVVAASILPLVHACDPDDASIIHENMRIGSSDVTNFRQVKAALERNYRCMGVACDEVGGIRDQEIETSVVYQRYAGPCECDYNSSSINETPSNVFATERQPQRCFPAETPIEDDPLPLENGEETEPSEDETEPSESVSNNEESPSSSEDVSSSTGQGPVASGSEDEDLTDSEETSGSCGSIPLLDWKLLSLGILQLFVVSALLIPLPQI